MVDPHIVNASQAVQHPDVWLQLLERCASISSCHPALIRDLGLQLMEQQQEVSIQQHTIEELQQHNTQLQQQVSGQQHTIQQLQQHDQQRAAEAAELREQVTELRGQVAQLMQSLQHRG